MIEGILTERCTHCGQCAAICPTNVFDFRPGAPPVVARVEDCQTCFLCELYCRADAIYVGADCETAAAFDPLHPPHTLGQYRRDSGWDEFVGDPAYENEHWRMESVFLRARDLARRR